jgi:hypothetical protein
MNKHRIRSANRIVTVLLVSLGCAIAIELLSLAAGAVLPLATMERWQLNFLAFGVFVAGPALTLGVVVLLAPLTARRPSQPLAPPFRLVPVPHARRWRMPKKDEDGEVMLDEDWRWAELIEAAEEMVGAPQATHARHRLERALEGIEG